MIGAGPPPTDVAALHDEEAWCAGPAFKGGVGEPEPGRPLCDADAGGDVALRLAMPSARV